MQFAILRHGVEAVKDTFSDAYCVETEVIAELKDAVVYDNTV